MGGGVGVAVGGSVGVGVGVGGGGGGSSTGKSTLVISGCEAIGDAAVNHAAGPAKQPALDRSAAGLQANALGLHVAADVHLDCRQPDWLQRIGRHDLPVDAAPRFLA